MSLGKHLAEWWHNLVATVYPDVCHVCGTTLVPGEKVMCLGCRINMPRTGLHTSDFNEMHQRLAGHVRIERAGGYFYYYREGDYARLIHKAKYNGLHSIARTLAADYAREIAPDGFFDGIDVVIPVPLHRRKLRRRGYNQSEAIARGISDVTGIPVGDHLIARTHHRTQTRLGAAERLANARHVYDAERGAELSHRHVLVVDDVLTTGATLLACCEAIAAEATDVTISVLTLAVAHMR